MEKRKIPSPAGNQTPTFQPVAKRYTDWATVSSGVLPLKQCGSLRSPQPSRQTEGYMKTTPGGTSHSKSNTGQWTSLNKMLYPVLLSVSLPLLFQHVLQDEWNKQHDKVHYRVHKVLCNISYHGEGLLAPRLTPSWRTVPLAVVSDCFMNILAATLRNWRPSPPSATSGRAMSWWQVPTLHVINTNILAATLHIWRPSPPSATWWRATPWHGDKVPCVFRCGKWKLIRRVTDNAERNSWSRHLLGAVQNHDFTWRVAQSAWRWLLPSVCCRMWTSSDEPRRCHALPSPETTQHFSTAIRLLPVCLRRSRHYCVFEK
jgi:hypothetical protein